MDDKYIQKLQKLSDGCLKLQAKQALRYLEENLNHGKWYLSYTLENIDNLKDLKEETFNRE